MTTLVSWKALSLSQGFLSWRNCLAKPCKVSVRWRQSLVCLLAPSLAVVGKMKVGAVVVSPCTYTDTTAEKMFILISQTLPSIYPHPPLPHGSSCPELAWAFLSLHGHSANWFRWKTNFFFQWSYFLGQRFPHHFQPAVSWMWVPAQSKGQPGGRKERLVWGEVREGFWQQ